MYLLSFFDNRGMENSNNKEKAGRLSNLNDLQAELDTLSPNARIKLETTNGAIEGTVTAVLSGSFSMKATKPDALAGADMEFLFGGALTGAVPQGVNTNKSFRISTTMPDGKKLPEQWSGEIEDLVVLG